MTRNDITLKHRNSTKNINFSVQITPNDKINENVISREGKHPEKDKEV